MCEYGIKIPEEITKITIKILTDPRDDFDRKFVAIEIIYAMRKGGFAHPKGTREALEQLLQRDYSYYGISQQFKSENLLKENRWFEGKSGELFLHPDNDGLDRQFPFNSPHHVCNDLLAIKNLTCQAACALGVERLSYSKDRAWEYRKGKLYRDRFVQLFKM